MRKEKNKTKDIKAKPFLKWAGGKRQIIDQIIAALPKDFEETGYIYIEPFVGGGAVLFDLLQRYPNIRQAIINDINNDLINAYRIIKHNVNELINILEQWESEYHFLHKESEKRKEYYYNKRKQFNRKNNNLTIQAALLIFLNKTCFNGLYRVNSKGEFNVPIGSYKKPMIFDKENLIAVSKLLQKVVILSGDFEQTLKYAGENTLFYLDPPYKPLSKTSSFNSYYKKSFNDNDQVRLAKFCKILDLKGCKWILNNSDVKIINKTDDFFEKLYNKFNIKRVYAKRSINSNPKKRGKLTELLITNYKYIQLKEKIYEEKASIYRTAKT